ncbi:MAG: response regulator [Pseudanabaenaceae cyanobacterium SKYGB_i_bin29]|nr:response regulator [Pseudanabaenaceae cyanobacterium SKYG29]MDW8421627.1 response regulator [Pseudanabaenaceae cyanobacterium SKYGB_i_bin29]
MDAQGRPKILVVDDEALNLQLIERILYPRYQVFTATDAVSASSILDQEQEIAVIISDQNMPQVTGTVFLSQVAESMPDTIRILMTARTDTKDLIEAINTSKIFKFIPKPFKREHLLSIVEQAVETYQLLRSRTLSLRNTLDQVEARYQSLFENALEGIFFADQDGVFQLVNPVMAQILGYPNPTALVENRTSLSQFFLLPETYSEFLTYLKQKQGVSDFETQFRRGDGQKFWVSLTARSVLNDQGQIERIEGFVQDITQRKRAEAGIQMLQTVVIEAGSAPDLHTALHLVLQHICEYTGWWIGEAWLPSLDRQTLQFSTAWYTPHQNLEEFRQLSYDLIFAGSDNLIAQVWRKSAPQWIWRLDQVSPQVIPRRDAALQHGISGCLALPIRSKQNVVAVLVFFMPQTIEQDSCLVGLINTIATQLGTIFQRKRDEAEILRMNQELALARDQALEASRAKSAFMATMSHELRTPLNAIIGYSEMLQEDARDDGREDMVADLQKIHSAGKQLLELINDILDISKIEAGKMEVFAEEFSIPDLLREIVDVVLPLVEKNNNELRVACDENIGTMYSDMAKVRQCLVNLLSNAAKFTQNGIISLAVDRREATNGSWVSFIVQDTGIGMSQETMSKLFRPFSQADNSTTRKYGGTGLGLAITKRFAQMMGGDITVESELNVGSTFRLYLPAALEKKEKQTEPPPPVKLEDDQPQPQQPVVLVIDDDPYVHDLLKRFLNKHGFAIKMAFNGLDGIRLAREIVPSAITLDVVMPGMDGWSVLGILKADPKTCHIPVIMLTIDGAKEKGYALGVSDFLTKPINRNRLLAALQKSCRRDTLVNQRILVVEDEVNARQVLRWMLEKEKCVVWEANNGRDALQRIAQSTPDLILLDLMMPEMDGFEFVETLRQQYPDWQVPILAITAMTLSPSDRQRLNGSVEKILQKGACSVAELLAEIHNLLPQQT